MVLPLSVVSRETLVVARMVRYHYLKVPFILSYRLCLWRIYKELVGNVNFLKTLVPKREEK